MAQKQTVLQIHQILDKHIVLAVMVWLGGYQLGSFGSRQVWEEKQPLHKKMKTQACPTKWATARGPFLAFPSAARQLRKGTSEPRDRKVDTQDVIAVHRWLHQVIALPQCHQDVCQRSGPSSAFISITWTPRERHTDGTGTPTASDFF